MVSRARPPEVERAKPPTDRVASAEEAGDAGRSLGLVTRRQMGGPLGQARPPVREDAAEPVEENTQSRIRDHRTLAAASDMKDLFERRHSLIRQDPFRLDKKSSHLTLPAFVDLTARHPSARTFEAFGFQVADEQTVFTQKQRIIVPEIGRAHV